MYEKKKDYRFFCKLFYCASPSETVQGLYKAGCKIAPHGTPCKRCRRCKYGVRIVSVDELHEITNKIF